MNHITTTLILAIPTCALCGINEEFELLKKQREQAIARAVAPINATYEQQLIALQRRALKAEELDTAVIIRSEIITLQNGAAKTSNPPPTTSSTDGIKKTISACTWKLKSADDTANFRLLPDGKIEGAMINGAQFLKNWRITGNREITCTWWRGGSNIIVFDMSEDWKSGTANMKKSNSKDAEGRSITQVPQDQP